MRRTVAVAVGAIVFLGVLVTPASAAPAPSAAPRNIEGAVTCVMGSFDNPMDILTNLPGCLPELLKP
ncbi:hypothetical protein [Streptomyces lanatus]|uniref:Secreted protein n=1 Tax=Streptomyces lanatus TaxID=66900 RepID=A0ABV1Y019_9ACTN|nr:hypothetical protein [Streptomyces lanatus]GHH22353.1 hypothetical protein GCM10018780_70740 [Streptomyces lanatus]